LELQVIRKYLDQLDTTLRYIILQRMSIIPLVAETKLENNIPVFQPEREEEIYNALQSFSLSSGLNPELLTDVYKSIIKDAHRIENEVIEGIVKVDSSSLEVNLMQILDDIDKNINEYINQVEIIRQELACQSNSGEDFSKTFTKYYKKKITTESKVKE